MGRLVYLAKQRGKVVNYFYGSRTKPGTLEYLKSLAKSKYPGRVQFTPAGTWDFPEVWVEQWRNELGVADALPER